MFLGCRRVRSHACPEGAERSRDLSRLLRAWYFVWSIRVSASLPFGFGCYFSLAAESVCDPADSTVFCHASFLPVKKWKLRRSLATPQEISTKNAGNLALTVQPFRPYNCGLSLGLEE